MKKVTMIVAVLALASAMSAKAAIVTNDLTSTVILSTNALTPVATTTNITSITTVPKTETTPLLVIPIDFKGTAYGKDGKKIGTVTTADWGPTGTVQFVKAKTVTGTESTQLTNAVTHTTYPGVQSNEVTVATSEYDDADSSVPTNILAVVSVETNGVAIVLSNSTASAVIGTNVTSTINTNIPTIVDVYIATTKIQTNQVPLGGGTNKIDILQINQVAVQETAGLLTDKAKYTGIFAGDATVGTNKFPGARQVQLDGTVKTDKKEVTKISLKVTGVWVDGVSTVKGTIKNAKQ